MSLSPTLHRRLARRRSRWPFVVTTIVVLFVAGAFAAKRFVNADRYRPFLVERITKNTGLPASVERMDIALFPAPALRARNISIGEGDFHATCSDLYAYPSLSGLLHGEIDIRQLDIETLAVALPAKPGVLRERFLTMLDAHRQYADSGEKSGSGVQLGIGRITAPGATIMLAGMSKPVFSGDLSAVDVLSPTITITADATSPAYGDGTTLAGAITLERKAPEDIGLGVHGNLDLTNLDTTTLFSAKSVPPAVATLHATIERTGATQIKIAMTGDAKPLPMEGIDLSPIAGAFAGVAWWDAGQVTVNDLSWKAPGTEFTADVTIDPDGSVASRIEELTANSEGIRAFLSAQPSESYRAVAAEDAQFTAKNVLIGVTAEKKLRLADGTASFSGIDLTLPKGQRAIAGFSGQIAFGNDKIKIESLKGEDLSFKGSVTPNFGAGSVTVDLSGRVNITRERLGMFMPIDVVKGAKGKLELENVSGTFSSGAGVPGDLSISGKLTGGDFAIDSPSWTDTISGVTATFAATPGSIDTTASASTRNLGNVSINGRYDIAKRTWTGTALGNLAKMDLPFLRQEAARKVAPGILAAYGDSQFAIALALPDGKKHQIGVTFTRKGPPGLSGNAVMLGKKEGWELGDLTVDASIPGDALQPMLPDAMRAGGLVPVHFARDAARGEFDAQINLKDNSVALNNYLTKPAGTAAALTIHGIATPGNWAAKQLDLTCLDQTIHGTFTETGFVVPQFDISAGALAALMPDGAKAGGRIRGNASTQPVAADITLENVNVALGGDLSVDNLNGAILYRDGAVTCKNLNVQGADSDFTMDLVSRDGSWSGALSGKRLNVNQVLAMKDTLQSTRLASNDTSASSGTGSAPYSGKFDINLGTVLYRKAEFNNVLTTVTMRDGDFELGGLKLQSHGGTLSGSVRIAQAHDGGRASTALKLNMDNVDLAMIDDVALDEARGLRGPASGSVDLVMYSGGDVKPFEGANGAIQIESKDGTFGKLGIATKVLSVLRTLEITRFRAPKLKDQGLSFDTCDSRATFRNGVMTIDTFEMTTPSYNIAAIGSIDFNKPDSEVLVHVNLLGTVLGPAEMVPGLELIADKLRTTGGLRILLTGSPADPKSSYGFGPRTNVITTDVTGALKSTGNIIRDEVINKAADVLKGILKGNTK